MERERSPGAVPDGRGAFVARPQALRRRAVCCLFPLVALLALGVAPPALGSDPVPETVVRVFELRWRRAEEAALLVRPLLTDAGSVMLQVKLNTLTVRDTAPAVERVAQILGSYDTPPRAVSISISLLKSSRGPAAEGQNASAQIKEVGKRLSQLLNLTSTVTLDSVVVQGTEGNSVAYAIGGGYRLEFFLEPSGDEPVVKLKGLVFERVRRDAAGKETRGAILQTSINVPVGQPFVLGVGRDENATDALFLVFQPTIVGRAGGRR